MVFNMNKNVRMFKVFFLLLILFVDISLGGMQRHNEQGLSPTHSYKGTGGNEVISNLNGNLQISHTAANISRPGLGINVQRSFNSHWRDPIAVFQLDLDHDITDQKELSDDAKVLRNAFYDRICLEDTRCRELRDSTTMDGLDQQTREDVKWEYKNYWRYLRAERANDEELLEILKDSVYKSPEFKNVDYDDNVHRYPSGLVTYKRYRVDSQSGLSNNWMAIAQTINNLVYDAEKILSYSNIEIDSDLISSGVGASSAVGTSSNSNGSTSWLDISSSIIDFTGSVFGVIQNWERMEQEQVVQYSATIGSQTVKLLQNFDVLGNDWGALSSVLGDISTTMSLANEDLSNSTRILTALRFARQIWFRGETYYASQLDKVAAEAALVGPKKAFAVIGIVFALWEVYNFGEENDAWDSGYEARLFSVASNVFLSALSLGSALSGQAVLLSNPQILVAAIAIQAIATVVSMVDDWNNEWDVVEYIPNTWQYGVNGYVGMVGTKYPYEQSKISKKFSYRVPSGVLGDLFKSSLHPMADLNLIRSDGGASRFILNASHYIEQEDFRYYSYTALNNDEKTNILYVDKFPFQTDKKAETRTPDDANDIVDPGDFYLVKEPNGTWAKFGATEYRFGGRTRGIHLTKTEYGDPFEYFWALPNMIASYNGDEVIIKRDSNLEITSVRLSNNDSRYVEIEKVQLGDQKEKHIVRTMDNTTELSSVSFIQEPHSYNDGKVGNSVVNMITEVHIPVSEGDTLKTTYQYVDGNLVKSNYPNGSSAEYIFDAANSKSVLDGHCKRKTHYANDNEKDGVKKTYSYVYNGWGKNPGEPSDDEDDPSRYLSTSVTTSLTAKNYNQLGSYFTESTTDLYRYEVGNLGVVVNENPCSTPECDVVSDFQLSIPQGDTAISKRVLYQTTRLKLVTKYIGTDGEGKKTDYFHDGDRLAKIVSYVGSSPMSDPDITLFYYDMYGNMLAEWNNPSNMLEEMYIGTIFDFADIVVPDEVPADFMTAEKLAEICEEFDNTYNTNICSKGYESQDRVTLKYYYNDVDNEFYKDTTLSKLVLDKDGNETDEVYSYSTKKVNRDNFNPYGRYVKGLSIGTAQLRRDADLNSEQHFLVGTITSYNNEYLRKENDSLVVSDVKSGETREWLLKSYEYDHSGNPFLVTGTKTYLDSNEEKFVYSKTVYETDYNSYPIEQHSYKTIFSQGDTPPAQGDLISHTRFNAKGWLEEETDFQGNSIVYHYDLLGRVVSKDLPEGLNTQSIYSDRLNNEGWLVQAEIDAFGTKTEAIFDGLGRLNYVKVYNQDESDSKIKQVDYGVLGKIRYAKDEEDRESFWNYDSQGRLAEVKIPKHDVLPDYYRKTISYDDNRRMVIEADENLVETRFSLNKGHL